MRTRQASAAGNSVRNVRAVKGRMGATGASGLKLAGLGGTCEPPTWRAGAPRSLAKRLVLYLTYRKVNGSDFHFTKVTLAVGRKIS